MQQKSAGKASAWSFVALCACMLAMLACMTTARAQLVIGSQVITSGKDNNTAGQAEAFKATASTSASIVFITVYLDAGSAPAKLTAGLYTDKGGTPGTLLTQGTLNGPVSNAWNTIPVPGAQVTAGANYWIAILSPNGSGTVRFHDTWNSGRSETSAAKTLTALPSTWATGNVFNDSPLAAYVSGSGTIQPMLSVSPATLSFAYTQGDPAPAAFPITVTNNGTGTLSFSASSNASWLSASPPSGSAPATEQASVNVTNLATGTYTGQITITANGAQGSPATVDVTLVVSAVTPQPVLSVSPTALTFNYTIGSAQPSPATLTVSNTGTGTLIFTANSNQPWLSVSPASGTATQAESVSVSTTGLAAGTYSGQIVITATGATGSPVTIPVTLNVVNASTGGSADWPMVNRDPSHSGFAANDLSITTSNVSTLALQWNTPVDGKVVAQPLYVAAVQVAGQTVDVVIAATAQNSIYALDANTGAQLWRRNFGADFGGCQPPGGSGIRSVPIVERTTGRVYVVPDDGTLHTLSLADGTDVVPTITIIDLPATNKVRGGLNLLNGNLYIASGSGGCDVKPWRGRIYRVDVSGAAPVLRETFDVIPSISGDSRGGGIWGYGGVTIDPATGNVFAATGADANGKYTPYGVRMLALTSTLSLLGTYEPPHPAQVPCSGAPCDVDFGATPLVFQPSGCPTLVAAGNKNGSLYVLPAADLAMSSTARLQAIAVNPADDWLGSGGLGGVPAFWAGGQMVFVTDAGAGVTGIAAGVVAFSVVPSTCRLQLAWSAPLPRLGSAQSSPAVGSGVVFVGEGSSGVVHAYDAATGNQLWNSGTIIAGGTYAAPSLGGGKLFVGSWNGQNFGDSGAIRAFAPGAVMPPPPPPPPPAGCTGTQPAVLLGTQTIQPNGDSNTLGQAEAFQTTAAGCGNVGSISLYLDATSTAAKIVVGLFADNNGHPGTLLGQGSTSAPVAGQWNTIPISSVAVTQNTRYWIALLGAQSGTIRFRDRSGGCSSETSLATNLTALPATWSTGIVYGDCPVSAYGNAAP
jgi:outer membrane protein assembly factor BamB